LIFAPGDARFSSFAPPVRRQNFARLAPYPSARAGKQITNAETNSELQEPCGTQAV